VSAAAYTPEMGERIAVLLSEWKLPTVAAELVHRLVAGGHDEALVVVAEVLELEAAGRKERRVERLRRASKLPPGKTFETLDKARVPRTALLKVQELSRGDFVEQAQLARSSSNSSCPPSSDPPGAPPPARPKRSGRPRGGQPGHERHERALVPPMRDPWSRASHITSPGSGQ